MQPVVALCRRLAGRLVWGVGLMLAVMSAGFLVFAVNPVAEARPSPTMAPPRVSPLPVQTRPRPTTAVRPVTPPTVKAQKLPVEEELRPTRVVTRKPTAAVVFPAPILPPDRDQVKRTATVPILMYHYISTPPVATDKLRVNLSVPPDMFEAQMKLLVENGFTTITLFDLYEHLATGKALPEKPIVLTFDDGYRDNYEQAFRILKAHNLVGTFFVLTAPADANDPAYLTWPMIKEMSDAGMDIQLHAKDHVDLRHRSYDYLVWEIIGGRQSIEGHTGKPVVFMAYPSGKYDDNVLNFLKNNNFWAAVTVHNGRQHTLDNPLLWSRLRVAGKASLESFAKLVGAR